MLSRRLQREGFNVLIARNGIEGVEAARTQKPELIIMDLVLPEMDGFQAATQLRENVDTQHIPIVALSASVLPEHQHRATDAGCDDFEVKPVDFPRLITKINKLINQSRQK